jgi:hypothetical protein
LKLIFLFRIKNYWIKYLAHIYIYIYIYRERERERERKRAGAVIIQA